MEFTTLGRTGLRVSVAGLGCGGHSRLGLGTGHDHRHARSIVDAAIDLGINFIDTARAYGTERVVGEAIHGRRERVVLSTKASPGFGDELLTADGLRESLDASLTRLGTEYVDVFHLHGVLPGQYAHCLDHLVPELQRQRQAGKIRFLGITERFAADTHHDLFAHALPDDLFDVVMVGHNLLNPSARHSVFPHTIRNGVGTLIMFAVRRALSSPAAARAVVDELITAGAVDGTIVNREDPLAFVTTHPEVESLVQAAYRFCRHEPGAHVILTGTGSIDHLRTNIDAILAPPLPREISARLGQLFGSIDSVSGD